MDTTIDGGRNDAFLGLVLLIRTFWGSFFWPLIFANAVGYAWCVYQALTYWLK